MQNVYTAKRTPVEKAHTYGLEPPEVVIIFHVTAWFNKKTGSVHDRPISIRESPSNRAVTS